MTTIETHQIVSFKRCSGAVVAWCTECLEEVEMVTPDQAALLAGVSLRDICCRISSDDLHLADTPNGGLICLNSLLQQGTGRAREISDKELE